MHSEEWDLKRQDLTTFNSSERLIVNELLCYISYCNGKYPHDLVRRKVLRCFTRAEIFEARSCLTGQKVFTESDDETWPELDGNYKRTKSSKELPKIVDKITLIVNENIDKNEQRWKFVASDLGKLPRLPKSTKYCNSRSKITISASSFMFASESAAAEIKSNFIKVKNRVQKSIRGLRSSSHETLQSKFVGVAGRSYSQHSLQNTTNKQIFDGLTDQGVPEDDNEQNVYEDISRYFKKTNEAEETSEPIYEDISVLTNTGNTTSEKLQTNQTSYIHKHQDCESRSSQQSLPSILSVSSSIRSRTISSPANMALARRTAGSINSLSSRRDHHSDDNISGRDTGCCGDSAVHDQDVKDTCFKEGELFVQGSKLLKKFQSKKTAYFCLYGRGPHSRARLVQYSSQKASKNKRYEPEVMIPASDVVLVESIDDYDQGYMFTILCRDNKLFLSTENEILRTEWIEALTDKLIHDCESPTSKHFCSADTSCSDIGPMSGNFQVRVHEDVKKYFGDDSPVNLVVENKTISIVTPNGLCLAKWPLDKLRKYGFVEDQNYFFVETGRQAQHGDAVFKFHTNQGKEIHQVVKNNKKYGVTSNSNQSLVPAVTFDPELAFSTNLYDQLPTTNPVQKPNADEENNVKLLFPVHPNKAVMQNSEASTRCSSKIDQNSSETESQRGPHGKSSVQSMIHGVEETSYLYTIPDVTKKSKPGNFNTETSPDIYTLPDISNKSKLMVTKKSKSGILNTETPPDIYALPDISNKSKQTVSSAEAIPPVYSIVTSKKSMKKIPSTPSKEYMTLSSTNTEISISQPVDKTVPVSNLNRSLVKSSPIYASPVELNVRKMGPLPIPPSAALKNNTKIKTAEPKLPEASVRNIKFSPQHVYENTSLLRITPTFSMTRKPDPPIIDSPPKSPRSYVQ